MKILLLSSFFIFCISLSSNAQASVDYSKISKINSTKETSVQFSQNDYKKTGSTLKRTVKIVEFKEESPKEKRKKRKSEKKYDLPF